jgi:hypothetical protein
MEKLKVEHAQARIEGNRQRPSPARVPELGASPVGDNRQAFHAHGGTARRQGQGAGSGNPGAHASEIAWAAGDGDAPDIRKAQTRAGQRRDQHRQQPLGVPGLASFAALPQQARTGWVRARHGHGEAAKTGIEGKDMHGR